jgi:mono/diheme cytochrome c family protein
MQFRAAVTVAGALLMGAGVWAQQSSAPTSAPTPPLAAMAMTNADQNALVEEYCWSCHNKVGKSGGLVLEGFNAASPLLSAELLEKMIRKVRAGQMPPANSERPDPEQLRAFVTALETRADAMAARVPDPGWRPFQRLNRAEYARVVKDLLDVDVDPSALLPPDTASGGFDNIADVQTVSPTLIAAYLRGAASVSRTAVGTRSTASASRRKVFACTPRTVSDEAACAETIIRRLLATAYRGAATDIDAADALAFYARGRQRGGFDDGIRLALQSILVSPKFLFRMEPAGPSGAIGDVALASRLSFFLWSRGPDDVLIAAARRGELHTPDQLAAQARRMLADPRAEALSTRFAAQWLRLQDLDKVSVDPALFPSFDLALAKAMRRETELVFADLIRRDGRVMDLVTSGRSFINERLAKHYGIPNVRGEQFRAVTLPEPRRGLLGQGSILTLTSLGTRTSPVLRGKWVLDVLLGTPPPPPPPNVPALDDSVKAKKDGAPLSTRQRVEEHRRNPSCAGCHRVIDPPGMALENFDATGAWRAADNGVAIDATSELYDGRRMDGAGGVRDALVAHEDMVLRNFTQQLMTYALGRRLTYRDMPAVRAIVRTAEAQQQRVSAFVTGIVTSDAFRLSRAPKDQ